MKKRVLSIFLIMTLFISVATPMSFAASGKTKKMTVYEDVIKVGNNVYCNVGDYIYKVNIKSGKSTEMCRPYGYGAGDMHYHKGYIYYTASGYVDSYKYCYWNTRLYRINLKNKKVQKVFAATENPEGILKYAIKGKKIYTQYDKAKDDAGNTKVAKNTMKLNGKVKKKSKVKVKMIKKKSNAKGYSIIFDGSEFDDEAEEGYVTFYLKTPEKEIKVCRYYAEWQE